MALITKETYYKALKNHRLIGLKCGACEQYTFPPKATCNHCGSREQEIVNLSNRGIIKTFTVIRVAPQGFSMDAPYIVAMIELNEGPWLTGNLAGINPEEATMGLIGQQVEITYQEAGFTDFDDTGAIVPLFNLA